MKIVSFTTQDRNTPRAGALLPAFEGAGEELVDFSSEVTALPQPDSALGWFDRAGASLQEAEGLVSGLLADPERRSALRGKGALLPLDAARLCAPVPRPGKVICIGLNYRDHAEESGMDIPERPLVFSKFPTSVVGPGDTVLLPPGSEQVDYEAELGVVIGRRATRVSEADAAEHVLGYVCVNDVSARDFQFADGQWQRGKSCDTFCPMGPFIATPDELDDPHALSIRFRRNGTTLQDSSTDQLIFRVPELIASLSQAITLEPGDLIATGTPPGVGFARKPPIWLEDGDRMEVEIEGLGVLSNVVGR